MMLRDNMVIKAKARKTYYYNSKQPPDLVCHLHPAVGLHPILEWPGPRTAAHASRGQLG